MRTLVLAALVVIPGCGRPDDPLAGLPADLEKLERLHVEKARDGRRLDPLPADRELTPAQVDLIESYWRARDLELQIHHEAIQEIQRRYDRAIREALPPEQHEAYARMSKC